MVVDPPPLREPVLLLRIQLRQPPGVGALRALSDSRRIVRPAVSRAPGGRRVAVAGGPAEGFRRGYPVGEFLAGGGWGDQKDGAGARGGGMRLFYGLDPYGKQAPGSETQTAETHSQS